MITAIRLTNFMAHRDAEILLGDGVTTLTGPNNTGKSAIVEGLRYVATNPPPKHVIRHGAKEARVEVELDDGKRIAWVRTRTATHYELFEPGADEPEFFRKLGKNTVPEEVRDLLRLDQVAIEGGQDVDVHVGDQKQPLFLIDDSSGSRTAKFFASSTEAAHLLAMQKLLKKKETDAKREESRLTKRMADLGRELDGFADLPAIEVRAEAARETEEALQSLARLLPSLERTITGQDRLARDLSAAKGRAAALRPLVAVGQTYDTSKLANVIEQLKRVGRAHAQAGDRAAGFGGLAGPPDTFPTLGLAGRLRDQDRLKRQISALEMRLRSVAELQPAPTLEDLDPLAGLVAEISTVSGRMTKGGQVLAVLEERIATKHGEVEKRAVEVGVCPLCGGDLDAGKLLGEGDGS